MLKVAFPMIYGKRKPNAIKQGNAFLRHTQFAATTCIMYMPVRNDRMQEDNTSDQQKQDIFGFEHFTNVKKISMPANGCGRKGINFDKRYIIAWLPPVLFAGTG